MAGTMLLSPLAKNFYLDSMATEWNDGIIKCYAGTPTAVGTTDPGTPVVVQFTKDGAAFTTGTGIDLGTAAAGEIFMAVETYEGVGLVEATITWFRHFTHDLTKWQQGTIATSGAHMTVTTQSVTVGGPVAMTSLRYYL